MPLLGDRTKPMARTDLRGGPEQRRNALGTWVDGFTRALRLRPEAWQAVLEQADEETRSA